tara:strand:- start:1130 stop:1807 length:678 start_codon:yes stop_codon:yes gene_type:complete
LNDYAIDIEEYPIFRSKKPPCWDHCDHDISFEPKIIVDIGADAGDFSQRCKSEWPNCEVYSFVLDSEHYKQCKSLGLEGCHFFHVALSYFDNRKFFARSSKRSYLSYYLTPDMSDYENYTGAHSTLPQLFDLVGKPIDILRINCSGTERDLIYHPEDLKLLKEIPYIVGHVYEGEIKNLQAFNKLIGNGLCQFLFTNELYKLKSHNIISYARHKDAIGNFWCVKR